MLWCPANHSPALAMKKSLVVLLLAVLVPSIGLGWLAMRSAEEQQIVLERRTAELYQKETEAVAERARSLVNDQRRAFVEVVRKLLTDIPAQTLAGDFTGALARDWPQKAVGFAVNEHGALLCPTARDAANEAACQEFLWDNGAFIGNKTIATVYPVPGSDVNRAEQAIRKAQQPQTQQTPVMSKLLSNQRPPEMKKELPSMAKEVGNSGSGESQGGVLVMKDPPLDANAASKSPSIRNVFPVGNAGPAEADNSASQSAWTVSDFKQLTAGEEEGVINRFVQDKLNMIFWVRPARAPGYLFGCLIEVADLRRLWESALSPEESVADRGAQPREFTLALLDDKTKPVVTQPSGSKVTDWKHPFVASEIGEALPHWEATLYLTHPEHLQQAAGRIRHTVVLLVAAALLAIACGGSLVILDTRRQLLLAQQKTDFVSNVSHELKTPLTSIRMFAELMHDGKADEEKRSQYLRIITVEAERLTRLINNVLDFARPERRQRPLDKRPLDLHCVITRVWESQELHLRDHGFTTHWEAAPPPYPVVGDDDAITQILVNLLSNAEKYSTEQKEVSLHSYIDGNFLFVSVLDRGSGVPAGEQNKIFDAFYRAHDSLASGVQGAGLGLTLAQRLAHEHNGEITYQPRPGGGSNFTLKLPLSEC